VAFFRNRRAGATSCADSLDAVKHQAFRTRVAGDARSFTDEVLIPGFVVGIHNIRDSISRPFQSFLAQAMVTFADDAIDTSVSARCDDLGDSWLFRDNGLGVKHPVGAFLPVAFVGRDADSLPGLLCTPVEQLPVGALTGLAGKDAVKVLALEELGRVAEATNFVLPHFTRGEHRRIQVIEPEVGGTRSVTRWASGLG